VPEILRAKVAVFADLHRKAQQVARQAAQLTDLNAMLGTQLDEIRQLNQDLTRANAELRSETTERRRAEARLRRAGAKLEERVQKRTLELAQANADLKHEIAERRLADRRLEIQYRVTRVVADAMTLDEAAPQILGAIAQHMGWEFGELWLVDEARGDLRRDYCWTDPGLGLARARRLAGLNSATALRRQRGEGLPGRVWSDLQSIGLPDLAGEPGGWMADYALEAGLRAGVSLSIQSAGQVYGVASFFSRQTGSLDSDALQILESLAVQIGQFIERRRSDKALRLTSEAERAAREAAEQNAERAARERERLARLQAATAALSQALTPEEVARVTVQQAALALDWSASALSLLSADGEVLELAQAEGYPEAALEALRRVSLAAAGPAAEAVRSGTPVWLEDRAALATGGPQPGAEALAVREALLAIPLLLDERAVGVVVLESAQRQPFSSADMDLLMTLGQQCALALERARLYAEAKASNTQLEARVAARTADLLAANAELAVSRADLRRLSSHLEELREEERARIAREVHDELGGALTAIKMDVVRLRRGLAHASDLAPAVVDSLLQTIDATIQTVRRIATELRPALLDDFGLVAALEWQLQEFGERAGLDVQFHSNREHLDLDQVASIALFRVFQETLTNIARHAQASAIDVSLEAQTESLVLRVSDNGRGIALNEVAGNRSFGLVSMRERVRLLSGELDISGIPGRGTTVLVRLPLKDGLNGQSVPEAAAFR
jgi:signal transduction histidine kinase